MRLAKSKHQFNSALLGMILGDGSMNNQNTLYIRHGGKQLTYVDEKVKFLKAYIKPTTLRTFTDKQGYIARYAYYNSKKLSYLYNLIYKKRKKVITKTLLNRFNEISLAFFYMDDGSLSLKNKKGSDTINARNAYLCTHGFTWEEAGLFKEMLLNKFGLKFGITSDKGHPRLWCNTENTIKLLGIVAPIVKEFPGMHYKLELKYKKKDIVFL